MKSKFFVFLASLAAILAISVSAFIAPANVVMAETTVLPHICEAFTVAQFLDDEETTRDVMVCNSPSTTVAEQFELGVSQTLKVSDLIEVERAQAGYGILLRTNYEATPGIVFGNLRISAPISDIWINFFDPILDKSVSVHVPYVDPNLGWSLELLGPDVIGSAGCYSWEGFVFEVVDYSDFEWQVWQDDPLAPTADYYNQAWDGMFGLCAYEIGEFPTTLYFRTRIHGGPWSNTFTKIVWKEAHLGFENVTTPEKMYYETGVAFMLPVKLNREAGVTCDSGNIRVEVIKNDYYTSIVFNGDPGDQEVEMVLETPDQWSTNVITECYIFSEGKIHLYRNHPPTPTWMEPYRKVFFPVITN